jgi:putative FmdB family regulatory protein
MASYLWQCRKCERGIEIQRPMKDYQVGPDNACECGANDYERVIEPSRFILQGTGWHRDEYNRRGPIK